MIRTCNYVHRTLIYNAADLCRVQSNIQTARTLKAVSGRVIHIRVFICTARYINNAADLYWAIQRSWFARVNVLCNLSRKKSREVAAHFRADF